MPCLCTRQGVVFALIIFLAQRTFVYGGATRVQEWSSDSILETLSASAATFTPYLPRELPGESADDLSENPDNTQSLYTMSQPSTFRFKNSKGQYVKMPVWVPLTESPPSPVPTISPSPPQPAPGSVFTFQFRTAQSSGLLLYLDDGGPRDFIEVALRGRSIEVRFKFGDTSTVKLTLGNNLDDSRWHSVKLEITGVRVSLSVDGRTTSRSASGSNAVPIQPRSFCYLGGMPKKYRLMDLSLPSVFFEKGLRGAIRRYAIDGRYQRPLEKYQVVEEIGSDLCYSERNPCRNNGSCYVLNNEPACDCTRTKFSGKYCEGRQEEAAATFMGSQWFEYDMKNRISSFEDTITLYFKTKQSDGLILHTGKSADFVNLSIKNGGIRLVVNLGSGAYEVLLKPTIGSFNDDRWHFLKVYRELRRVNLTVDNAETTSGFTQNDYTQLTLDDVFYIGGSPATPDLPGAPAPNNFVGCLKEVTYENSDSIYQFSQMAKSRNPRIRVRGNIEYRCSSTDVSGPVTFRTSESYLELPQWQSPEVGGIQLGFRTNEPHGLILFGSGNTTRDFIALELYNGHLYLLINLGSGIKKTRLASQTLNDGSWHSITVNRAQNVLVVNLDNEQEIRQTMIGSSRSLDLEGPLYLGATDFKALQNLGRLPKGLWTTSLKYGFVGCIKDLLIDGIVVDIQAIARSSSNGPETIAPECNNLGRSYCDSQPCKNGGKCREGWNRFICDCLSTSYTGATCEFAVPTLGFNGSQSFQFPFSKTMRTQAEELSFRFKTPLSTGLLFTTTSADTADRLSVKLVKGGQVKLTVNIDCVKKNCTAPRQGPDSIFQGQGLNDNQWHTVKVLRYGRRLSLNIDGNILGSQLTNGHTELQFDAIHLAKANGKILPKVLNDIGPPFVGLIQNLVFNNETYIDTCLQQEQKCSFTGTLGEVDIISNSVTFGNKKSFVSVGTLDAYSSMFLFFTMKTTVSNGLILYNAGKSGDFIAVELVNGFLRYLYNLGNGVQIISSPDQRDIDDNRWHKIKITRDTSNKHTLSVDGVTITYQGSLQNTNLDLEGGLYIGGVKQDMYYNDLPDLVSSRFGFQGCLGTFDFNGRSPQLLGGSILEMAGNVSGGCMGPTQACKKNSCLNGGICRREWNSYSCDCSMTSYAGKRCQTHVSQIGGATYRFNGGILVYKWPTDTFPSSRKDSLALGFATAERNSVLTRISSFGGTPRNAINDFMQVEIVEGRLTLRFNIGSKDVVLTEPMNVADGQYHRVVISRVWMNATMRVDNWPLRRFFPKGNRKRFDLATTSIPLAAKPAVDEWFRRKETKNTVFNSQSTIQIGGLIMDDNSPSPATSRIARLASNSNANIVRPFKGFMSGFFFNNIGVFSLAQAGDERISKVGDVTLIDDSPITPTPGVPPSSTTMATLTTFTTSSTKQLPDDMKNVSVGSNCDEDLCSEETDRGIDDAMQGDDQTSQVTPRAKGDPTPVDKGWPGASSTQPAVKNPPKITITNTVESTFNNDTRGNYSDNLLNGDNEIIDPKSTGFLGKILNGTTAMVGGIVGAAVICIVALLFAIYKYRHRYERGDNAYRLGEVKPSIPNGRIVNGNGNANGHGGSIVKKKNGSVKSNGKAIKGREIDKEYYV